MSKSLKKSILGKSEGSSTSKPRAAPKENQHDEELARRLDGEINAGFNEDAHIKDRGHPTSGNPKEVQEAVDFVQRYAADVLDTCCYACGRQLIRELNVSEWTKKWEDTQGMKPAPSACGRTCQCGVVTCLGCGMEARAGDARYMAEYQGLKLDYCCSKGGVFVAWVVLCQYDNMELHLQERSRHNEAATRQMKEMINRNPARKRLAASGTGYGSSWTTNPFQWVEGHSPVAADEGYRRPGLRQALNFRQVDAETDSLTGWIIGILIELLPRRDEPTKKVSPVMSSMIELSLLQDRVAELLRNDSLQDVNKRASLYFATFEFVGRLGHHPMLDYLVREERFKKQQSAGLYAIATTGGKGKGKGKGSEREALTVASKGDGMAPSLVSCLSNLATQSKVLLSGSNNAAAGRDILEVAQRVNKVYTRLIGEGKTTVAAITTWSDYHKANCLVRKQNVSTYLCPSMAKLASQVINPDKGRMGRLVTEACEMTTSLPEGIFVMVDEVRPDIMKALIVGPKDTPYEGGLFEFDIVCGAHYPMVPPSVWLLTTGQGKIGFNPNLYATGKVCLSLINTWPGSDESKWQPNKSTIFSVLVSIQSMILWQWPYENEPGHENAHLNPRLLQVCLNANKSYRADTLKYATLDWLTRKNMREGIWKDVVRDYFRFCGKGVVESARKWEKERAGGSLVSTVKGKWLFGKGSVDELEAQVEKIRK